MMFPLRKTNPPHGDLMIIFYKNLPITIVHIFLESNDQAEIIIEILKEVEKKHEDKASTEHIFSEQIHSVLFNVLLCFKTRSRWNALTVCSLKLGRSLPSLEIHATLAVNHMQTITHNR